MRLGCDTRTNGLGLRLPWQGTAKQYVIVLEKRSNFAVKLIFQYEPLKTGTLIDFVHNSECLNECNST